jgi:hypothetical protein
MRAIRQVPQSLGVWERLQEWFGRLAMPRMALAGAAATLLVAALAVATLQETPSQAPDLAQQAQQPLAPPQPQAPAQPPIYHVSATMILAATAEVSQPLAPAVVEELDPMELLLVQQDTSVLTDSELALLVY